MAKAKSDGRDIFVSLLDYRNTPTEGISESPAQRLMQRPTRTLLPATSTMLEPRTVGGVRDKLESRWAKHKSYFGRSSHPLSSLLPGDVVHVHPHERKKTWKKGVVLAEHHTPWHTPRLTFKLTWAGGITAKGHGDNSNKSGVCIVASATRLSIKEVLETTPPTCVV